MRVIQAFSKIARQNMSKVALITETNQLSYEDILHLLHTCDSELRSRGVRAGATLVVSTDRPEINLVFALLLSQRSYNVIFSSIEPVIDAAVDYDFHITTTENDTAAGEKRILIDASWFAALGTAALPDSPEISGDGGSFTFRSSGSTGKPKFIASSEFARIASLEQAQRRANAPSPKTRFLSSLSMTMGWAMSSNLGVLLVGGSIVVLGDHRTRLLQYIDLYRINVMETTPVVLRRILEVDHASQYLTSLELVRIGGAYSSESLLLQFSKTCAAAISVGYGASEIGGICNSIFDPESGRPDGYIGEFHRSDLEITFFDEKLNPLPEANEGIVGFKPKSGDIGRTYLNAMPENERTGFIKGYFFPGDIMRLEGKSLYIVGRVKNIINFGGNKVSLDAIQAILEEHIKDCVMACLAVPDEFGLEQLVVVHEATRNLSLAQVNAVIDQNLGTVRAVNLIRVAQMPLTESGKIDTEKLRKKLT